MASYLIPAHSEGRKADFCVRLPSADLDPGASGSACRKLFLHFISNTPDSDLLKEADSLSFFTNNLGAYLAREGEAEALRRSRWGVVRLSEQGQGLLATFSFKDTDVACIVRRALAK